MSRFSRALIVAGAVLVLAVSARAEKPADAVKFVKHQIGHFRSEACCVADFNNDGKLDIMAGPYLYLAPDWKPVKVREVSGKVDEQGKGYYNDFMNLAIDVDGDGLVDVVSCSWFDKSSTWFRNPGKAGGLWAERLVEKNGNFECGELWDIDGDGKALEILPDVQRTVWYERGTDASGKQGLICHVVSEKLLDFGGGVGDINGDGRPDIIRPGAWYEAPADPRGGAWKEHPASFGAKDGKATHTAQIWAYDVNCDGLNDVICSSAHGYGIFWYEQVRKGSEITWKQHLIDDTWTQAHSITLADINGDGTLDLVTGKRFMAHNGGDPGAFEPIGVYWYELKRGPSPKWIKHAISYNEGIGAGMNAVVVDLDGDGDLDIVVTGKWGGPVWFENKTK